MATPMGSEVSCYQDPVSGARVAQITAWPCVNGSFYFHDQYWTPDSKTFLLHSTPGPRGSRPDLYRVNVDGHGLIRLTDGQPWTCLAMHPQGKGYYYLAEGAVWLGDLETGEPQQVARLPQGVSEAGGGGSITWDGRVFVAQVRTAQGESGIYRLYPDTGQGEVVEVQDRPISHTQIEPSRGELIAYQLSRPGLRISYWWIPVDGGAQAQPFQLEQGTGHWMWVGDSGRLLSTFVHPRGAIATIGPQDREPTVVVEAPVYFWHAASSLDGVWAVSDTNWPDVGIQLVHLPSGRHDTLCLSGSNNGAWNGVHPHPSFSPDGSLVVFESDRTGVPQVYLVQVPPALKQRLSG